VTYLALTMFCMYCNCNLKVHSLLVLVLVRINSIVIISGVETLFDMALNRLYI